VSAVIDSPREVLVDSHFLKDGGLVCGSAAATVAVMFLWADVTHEQNGRVLVESRPRVVNDGVGGGTQTLTPRGASSGEFPLAV